MVGSLLYAAVATHHDIAQAVGAVAKFMKSDGGELVGYFGAGWAGDWDATTGSLFLMAGGPVSWLGKKQPVVALSTSEAEYVLQSMATQEAVRFLSGRAKPTVIMEDNRGTIAIARNPVAHARTIIRYHYLREAVQEGALQRNWFRPLNLSGSVASM